MPAQAAWQVELSRCRDEVNVVNVQTPPQRLLQIRILRELVNPRLFVMPVFVCCADVTRSGTAS
jgi:hypothetical protein